VRFTELELAGAWRIDIEPHRDDRGFFARTYCAREFTEHGLVPDVAQCSTSFNAKRGTVRGMHYQLAPHAEEKVVRCTAGAIFDVIVDIRPDSRTYSRWCGLELSAENRRMLYIPTGFAHGFQTLTDNAEVLYQISVEYAPGASRGIRWTDPSLNIAWPITAGVIVSERDASFPGVGARS
jgi:dTDP-4-dehydrorhamnose 3,5-epimerase